LPLFLFFSFFFSLFLLLSPPPIGFTFQRLERALFRVCRVRHAGAHKPLSALAGGAGSFPDRARHALGRIDPAVRSAPGSAGGALDQAQQGRARIPAELALGLDQLVLPGPLGGRGRRRRRRRRRWRRRGIGHRECCFGGVFDGLSRRRRGLGALVLFRRGRGHAAAGLGGEGRVHFSGSKREKESGRTERGKMKK